MPFFPQTQVALFLVHVAVIIFFSLRIKEYDTKRRIRLLIFCYCIAITTKVIDIVYIYYVDMYRLGAYNIYYALPLYSCDINLIMAIFMTYFNLKNKGKNNKKYEVINKLITYLFFTNGFLVPLLLVEFESPQTFLEMFNSSYVSIFSLDNNIVHFTYSLLAFLYGTTFNVYKKTYKNFWMILAFNAGITLVVHIINLIFQAAGYETSYMYTITYKGDSTRELLYAIFGKGAETVIKLVTAPILEGFIGAVGFVFLQLLVIYLIHMFYYKAIRKEGLDNLFYLKLINPNTSITL